jgi:hypothetical protein
MYYPDLHYIQYNELCVLQISRTIILKYFIYYPYTHYIIHGLYILQIFGTILVIYLWCPYTLHVQIVELYILGIIMLK